MKVFFVSLETRKTFANAEMHASPRQGESILIVDNEGDEIVRGTVIGVKHVLAERAHNVEATVRVWPKEGES